MAIPLTVEIGGSMIAGSRMAGIRPNAPLVVSETIDGETIIMHHGTGHYFSGTGSAAVLWEALQAGIAIESLAEIARDTFGLDKAHAVAAVDDYVALLLKHDLVVSDDNASGTLPTIIRSSQAFAAPLLEVHTDLADMLLLDPIHDVDESGWPSRPPAAA